MKELQDQDFMQIILEQDYRNFDYNSPWQGTEYIKEIKKNNE